jgi:hypothetical protein
MVSAAAAVYTQRVRHHQWIDQRSRALHDAVATRLEADPALLNVARANLRRWMSTNPSAPLREWQSLLDNATLPQLVSVLRADNERAAWLRQSSPFAGILTSAERQTIMQRYDSRRA